MPPCPHTCDQEATMSTNEQATAPAELLDEQFLRDFAAR
jgi:hypothetical protein